MSNQEAYEKLLASRPEGKLQYETVILSHPDFTKTYYLVIGPQELKAFDNDGIERTFEPASIISTNAQNTNDLDQDASFTIADVKNILDAELDLVPLESTVSPLLGYGIYHSDYLEAPVEFTEYEIKEVPQQKGGFTIKAGAPDLNSDETGEIFTLDRFPSLRGVIS